MVDDDLCAVGEVAKLGLPQTKRVWVGLSVAVLEAENCEFREVGAGSNELPYSIFISVTNCFFDRTVVTILILVEDVSVSVREGASFNVLS